MSVNTKLAAQALPPVQPRTAKTDPAETLADRMSVGFADLLDVVNPLQQVPVVSSLYREATGESISIPARLAGGFLFGGPAGLIGSAAMVLFEEITGDSLLGHLGTLADGAAPDTPAAMPAAAAAIPWLKADGDGGAGAPPSAASLAEALRRTATGAGMAAGAAPPPAAEERPAPQTLAKLYALHATDGR